MKTIGIITYGAHERSLQWGPDSVLQGIGGSEEAVIHMAKHLAEFGHRVVVYGNPPFGSIHASHSSNPRYVQLERIADRLDVAIAWRRHNIGAALKSIAKSVYLWPHDYCTFRMTPEECGSFDGIFWLSRWQREQWCSLNPELLCFTEVYGNGIDPAAFRAVQPRSNPYSCIYGSNYGRGLDVILEIWPAIKQRYPLATLDIYYGWQHWGDLPDGIEQRIHALLAKTASLGVRERGKIGHRELHAAYETASLWTYPCVYPEVFCISALKAQMAGAVPVVAIPQASALSETVRAGFCCTDQQEYFHTLCTAMDRIEQVSLAARERMGDFIRKELTWQRLAARWHRLLT